MIALQGHHVWKRLLGLAAAVLSLSANAQDIELQGIMGSRAIVTVDGQRHVLAAGETTPGGVRIERIEPDWIEVAIGDRRERVQLGSRVTRRYVERGSTEARVYSDSRGMFVAVGSINGFPVRMLLDTGATYVGIGTATARNLGINYRLRGSPTVVQTANGATTAFEVTLSSVSVGEISLSNVKAFVVDGAGLGIPLLGMSFLRRLEVQTRQGTMTLRKRN